MILLLFPKRSNLSSAVVTWWYCTYTTFDWETEVVTRSRSNRVTVSHAWLTVSPRSVLYTGLVIYFLISAQKEKYCLVSTNEISLRKIFPEVICQLVWNGRMCFGTLWWVKTRTLWGLSNVDLRRWGNLCLVVSGDRFISDWKKRNNINKTERQKTVFLRGHNNDSVRVVEAKIIWPLSVNGVLSEVINRSEQSPCCFQRFIQ